MSIDAMFQVLDALDRKEFGIGATQKEIDAAEQALGVNFPESYKAFLSRVGWAEIYYDTLYGLGPSVAPPYELVKNALCERHRAQPLIPHDLIAIMNDGAGNNYCLDTAKMQNGECPVVFWDHEHEDGSDQTPQQVASSFDQWLIDQIVNSPCADDP